MLILSTLENGFRQVAETILQRASDVTDPSFHERERVVREILERVRVGGDEAVAFWERQFGWKDCQPDRLALPREEWISAAKAVSQKVLEALTRAKERLEFYHQHQKPKSWSVERDGTVIGERFLPIKKVGIYVPGGRARYPSTVLHAGVPAQIAGVPEIYLVTPPDPEGHIAPEVLRAAEMIGVKSVFRVGGAHGIAALAFGTETVPKVDKIVGPGGLYPVMAKKLLYGTVGIDLLPGPSEVAVVADDSAPAPWVAYELLAQAEHGPDSIAHLFSPSLKLIRQVHRLIGKRVSKGQFFLNSLLLIQTRDLSEAIALVNEGAYEHIALMTEDPTVWLDRIQVGGAIFLGPQTSVVFGDYLAGPSHILPTGRTARFSSGLTVSDFLVRSSFVSLSEKASATLSGPTAVLARSEGLPFHAQAALARASLSRPRRRKR
ncbi:MAG: histidinol dehydrogenase [Armatimonadetes bacterium]|nr:histidinol dehydrogenase [Armatimonadota bacterium]MDW8120934.1 histidinol dehydrogenase [Armatimonadota bacterium]